MSARKESGADELRRVVRLLNASREDAVDGFTAIECVRLAQACLASPWDLTPDELTRHERTQAAARGKLSAAAVRRLTERFG